MEKAGYTRDGSRPIGAIIFDLDGTLVNTEVYFQRAWREAAAQFGYHLKPEMALRLRSLGRPYALAQFQAWFGPDCDHSGVSALCKQILSSVLEENGILLKSGAEELLRWLKERGIVIALATSGNTERATDYLTKTHILSYFDKIICSDMVERGKPAPDTYLHACRQLGTAPETTFAVEDSPNGVRSAFGAGCNVIMVPDLTQPDDELKSMLYGCASTLADIIPYVEGWR